MGDDHAAYIKAPVCKDADQTEYVQVIGNSQIITDFVFCDVRGIDDDDDFRLVGKLHQHAEFAVRFKARKDSGGMIVVKELAAEFKIQFITELANTFTDVIGLHGQVFGVVEPLFLHDCMFLLHIFRIYFYYLTKIYI